MNVKRLRHLAFTLHRTIGLTVGLLLILVGLTGSLLVFEQEFDHLRIAQQYGTITPQLQQVSPEVVVNTIQSTFATRKDLKLFRLYVPDTPASPYLGQLVTADGRRTEVFVNPYTGKLIGERQQDQTLNGVLLKLHYSVLAGDTGRAIVGMAAFLLCVLSITGLILWPGWHKLLAGFKIKRNAHPKRLNFDIHKVVGIIAVVFLFVTAFTGFCWNFSSFTNPIIYAATFTQKQPKVVSKPRPGQVPLSLTTQLVIADAALPGAKTKSIIFPRQPQEPLRIRKKLSQEAVEYGNSNIYLDQYSGVVLRVDNGLKLPLGERVLNSFVPIHYGTFGGLPTRIFYVFVGLTPLILFKTGVVMWWYRYRKSSLIIK